MRRVVLGLGMASAADRDEVRALARRALDQVGVGLDDVALVATRHRFVDDDRARLGPPVRGVDDDVLVARYPVAVTTAASAPRFPARVAEGCALTAAGPGAELVVSRIRSAHATAAVAIGDEA